MTMPLHCADCDHTFLLSPDGATVSAACPNCGGDRLERDQPSGTESDGKLLDMVDPSTGLDQGGNPLQEGIFGQTDGGWQPYKRRDESFASVRTAFDFDFSDSAPVPTHKFIINGNGRVYSLPNPTHHEDIAEAHGLNGRGGYPAGHSLGELHSDGSTTWYQHDTQHSPEAMASMLYGHFGQPVQIDPSLQPTTNEERFGLGLYNPKLNTPGQRELDTLYGPPRPREFRQPLDRNEGLVRGGNTQRGTMDRTLDMEPYMPWTHEADTAVAAPAPEPGLPQHTATVTPGPHGIHAGTTKWLSFLDAHVNGLSARKDPMEIFKRYGMRDSPEFGQPVTVAVHHPEHIPGAVETIQTSAEGFTAPPSMKELAHGIVAGTHPAPPGIDASQIKLGGVLGDLAGLAPAAVGLALAPETGGASLAIGGLASKALPSLMKGALMGTGSHMVQGLLGTQDAAGQAPSGPAPAPRDLSQLARVADLVTPHGNPGYHDSPDGDTHQFPDESDSTAQQNPHINGEAGGAAQGEDNVEGGIGSDQPSFSPGTLERADMLLPLILHHHNSPNSAASDPQIMQLHEMLEREHPGYLEKADTNDPTVQQLLDHIRQPDSVHAKVALAPVQQMQQGQALLNHPQNTQAQPGQLGADACPYCGSQKSPDGTCQVCGAKTTGPTNPQALPQQGQAQQHGVTPGYTAFPVTGANHQGPVTQEQQAAVSELLIAQNRQGEIPTMLKEPYLYSKELAEVANKLNVPENLDPGQQPPAPPAQEIAPPGATMPMPNPADPTQQMAAAVRSVQAADHVARRCPKCGSATTGILNAHGDSRCHACGNVWTEPDTVLDSEGAPPKVAAEPLQNTVGVPAADQQQAPDVENDQDSSNTWQDDNGQPLVEDQEYELHSPKYAIPDIVRIEKIKPDGITVSTIGEYNNQGDGATPDGQGQQDPLSYSHEITKEEADLEQYTFTPSDGESQAGDQSLEEYQNKGQAPVNTEPQPAPAFHSHVEAAEDEAPDLPDDHCPSCRSDHITSSMSSATTEFHECYRCAHTWETKEEDYTAPGSADREWIRDSSGPGGDDFFSEFERVKAMRESGQASSRNLSDIAAKDPRLQAIHQHLDAEAQARTAGKKYTPREQREFINESGEARNADKLDLAGTHYDQHRALDMKANGLNVPDEHMFLGF